MRHSFKMAINTAASYFRIACNAIVTLIVTRIALSHLGVNDFGLYNLLAGTIALLSFVNGALLISSQRYFSIAIGEGNMSKLKHYYSSSIAIHAILSVVIIVCLLFIQPILFNGVLNIEQGKEIVAQVVYDIMVISSALTMLSIPFAALMNAYEDIAALSFINIGSYVIRLCAAFSLMIFSENLLIIYSVIILVSIFFKVFGEYYWCRRKYAAARIKLKEWCSKSTCKEMMGFAGWNTLGSCSVLIRDQGVAVILNVFFGTVVNAAYGIANQVNSLVLSFASNLTTVFAPAIIQAKGAGDNNRMLFLAVFSSKLSFTLSSLFALPILTFLHNILHIWLGDIPEYTEIFCRYIIFCFLFQQIYPGINRAIYATGRIRLYQIAMFIAFTIILPVGILLFKMGYAPYTILYMMTFSQIAFMFFTVYIARKLCALDIKKFIVQSIILPIVIFSILLYAGAIVANSLKIDSILGIIVSSVIIDICYLAISLAISFEREERKLLNELIATLKNKIC